MSKIAITGTTSGIGQALAIALLEAHDIMHINRPEYDLSDIHKLEKIDFSTVDALILNAWVLDKDIRNSVFEHHELAKWQYIVNCNLVGNLFLIQAYLKARENGTIIFVSSATVTRRKDIEANIMHKFSKKAMSNFIEDIRYEMHYQKKNIRFVDVKPGLTRKSKHQVDHSGRIPTSHDEVVKGIVFALDNPAILNIDFEKHEHVSSANKELLT